MNFAFSFHRIRRWVRQLPLPNLDPLNEAAFCTNGRKAKAASRRWSDRRAAAMGRSRRSRPLLTPPNDGTQNENRLDLRVALKKGAGQMICSSLYHVRFIVRPFVGPDSNSKWRNNSVAGRCLRLAGRFRKARKPHGLTFMT